MKTVLCLTFRFLDPVPQYHGRNDDDDPEWPPSPLRLFQALVSASANHWRGNQFQEIARPALQWIEAIQPSVVSPSIATASFLGDYQTDELQYRALMDSGLTFAKAHSLRLGIALSAAQMAQLTADIVWLVEKASRWPMAPSKRCSPPRSMYACSPAT